MDWTTLYADRMARIGDSAIIALLKLAERPDVISFAGGLPDPKSFPILRMKEVVDWVLDHEGAAALQYGPTAGYSKLREWIADRMGRLEQTPVTADGVIVTSSGVEALDLIAKVLLNPGDTVIVEAPTYLAALHVFRSYQAELVDVPIDADGMIIDALEERLADLTRRGIRPKLLYTIPTFQNPAGVTLAADRRRRLVEVADRAGVPVIEDPAYGELRYEGDRLPSLVSLNPEGVLFANTFSKIFGPGVRLGWITAPPGVIAQLCQAKQGTDQCSSTLGQRVVYEYGRRGLIERQVAASLPLYREKRDLTLAAMARYFPSGVTWTRPAGGFYSWVTLPDGVETGPMLEWAIAHEHVAYVSGPPFYADGRGANQLRLCFSFVAPDKIEEGIRRLGRVIEQHIELRHHRRRRE
ncbi:MAG: PLP-dependent aminotransferase family protein [Candidatus Latescibacteria bacterium]|nr:PLP-dependent aminotransferase family protein [Candidatus Latescibacterota bacterium]